MSGGVVDGALADGRRGTGDEEGWERSIIPVRAARCVASSSRRSDGAKLQPPRRTAVGWISQAAAAISTRSGSLEAVPTGEGLAEGGLGEGNDASDGLGVGGDAHCEGSCRMGRDRASAAG